MYRKYKLEYTAAQLFAKNTVVPAQVQSGFCYGRGFENNVAFDHTFYTGADPKSFGGGV